MQTNSSKDSWQIYLIKVVTATLTLDEHLFRTAHIKALNITGKTIVSLTHRYLLFNEFAMRFIQFKKRSR